MDDQRQTGAAGGADVLDKAVPLPVALFLGVKIIQAGLADRHHPGVVGQAHQLIGVRLAGVLVERVHAHGGVHVGVALGQLTDTGKGFQIDTDAQHMADAIGAGGGHHGVEITVVGIQIKTVQVAVGIHQIGTINSGVGHQRFGSCRG